MIAPIFDVAYDMQREKGGVNIKKTHGYSDGLWSSSIYVNTYTNTFYNENDFTYTIINVPQQGHKTKKGTSKYHWIFKLKDKDSISIALDSGVTIIFLGKYMIHRQSCNVPSKVEDGTFFDLASCGNEQLYRYIRKPCMRV